MRLIELIRAAAVRAFEPAQPRLPADEGGGHAKAIARDQRAAGAHNGGRPKGLMRALFEPPRPRVDSDGRGEDTQTIITPAYRQRAQRQADLGPTSLMRVAAKMLFEPARPRSHADEAGQTAKVPAEGTDRDKAKCVDYVLRSWRLYVVVQQQYRALPLTDNIDKFARSVVRDLAKNFLWLQKESKVQILAIVFAAIIRSGTHPESETREAIKQIWPRLMEEVRWPV
jgi:hypothetical protein